MIQSCRLFRIGLGFIVSVLVLVPYLSAADTPIWAKHATSLDLGCSSQRREMLSPDKNWSAVVLCSRASDGNLPIRLQISDSSQHRFEVELREGAKELLWAPNSKAFLVNGGQTAYSGFFVVVYEIAADGPHERDIVGHAEKDMVTMFPPCHAANRDVDTCALETRNPQWGMSGIGWAKDSGSVFVFAEVPCSSSHGGIMCQVMGYRVSLSSSKVLERLTAAQVKAKWGGMMAWPMRVPDPPTYGAQYPSWQP